MSLIQGQVKEWALDAGVEPIRIPGYWWHSSSAPSSLKVGSPARAEEKVMLILHGGGYVLGTAHPSGDAGPAFMGIMNATASMCRSFAVEYRLSSTSPFPTANPFPAALLDSIAAYNHLITVSGFLPENIIIAGDSAGGHIGLSLLRYLAETHVLPVPGGFIGHCSNGDISKSHLSNPDSSLLCTTDAISVLHNGLLGWGFQAYAGPLHDNPDAELNPYLCPGSIHPSMDEIVSFKGFPKILLSYGGAERLRDSNRVMGRRMRRDLGDDMVTILETPDATHDFLAHDWHEPARSDALSVIGKWVDNLV